MSLHYREYGDGRPLLILHGLFGSADNWHSVAQKVLYGFRTIVPDLPNHGASPHLDHADYATMVSAVGAFLDELGLRQPVIAGHSMGAKIAMQLALLCPTDVGALIVVDMAPRRYDSSHRELLDAMRSVPLSGIASRGDADQALADRIPNDGVRSFLLKNLVRAGSAYRWRLNIEVISRDYDRILEWNSPEGIYTGPALFVGGDRSTYLQPERDRGSIQALFPNAVIRMIPDAGHWLHSDRQIQFLEVFNDFLAQLEHV